MSDIPRTVGLAATSTSRRDSRNLIHQVAQLTQSELNETEFYSKLLHQLAQALQATNVSAWICTSGGRVQLASQAGVSQEILFGDIEQRRRHERLVTDVLASGHPLTVPVANTVAADAAEDPGTYCLLFEPVLVDSQVATILEVITRAEGEALLGVATDLTMAAEFSAAFHRNLELHGLRRSHRMRQQQQEFNRRLHVHNSAAETAYFIANDGRRLVDCDRLSVVMRRGRKYRVEAISSQDSVNRRANSVRKLEYLTSVALATGEGLRFPNSNATLPEPIHGALNAYLDESQAKRLQLCPLLAYETPDPDADEIEAPKSVIGALVAEDFSIGQDEQSLWNHLEDIGRHCAIAMQNACENRRPVLLSSLRVRRNGWSAVRQTGIAALVVAGILTLILLLIFVKTDFTLVAKGALQPEIRRHIYARADGVVAEVSTTEGQAVSKGQTLVQLRNSELDLKLEQLRGELHTKGQKLATLKASRLAESRAPGSSPSTANELAAEQEELTVWIESLKRQRELLIQEMGNLRLHSPIDGVVIGWDLREHLAARPVQRGQRLMTVADLEGPWLLELNLADRRLGHFLTAQNNLSEDLEVSFILATDPGQRHTGRIRSVAKAATLDQQHGQTVHIKVGLSDISLQHAHPGAEVTAKIHCGQRSLGYVWFHELLEFAQARILFHL